jgi:hypothetical protein
MALPEKEWFTLEEIAQRWGCSVEDLWHYAETDKLRLSVIFPSEYRIDWLRAKPGERGIVEWHRSERTKGPIGLPSAGVDEFRRNPESVPLIFAPVVGPFSEIGSFGAAFEGTETLRPKYVDGPVIARAERDRFEQEYRIGAAAGKMPSERELEALDPRERASLLRIIAALAAHAELPPQPHKAAQIIASIAARHGIALPSEKTIAAKIDEARKAADA